jgi:hypothetical protein
MRAVLKFGCGLDVHKRTVTGCLLKQDTRGKLIQETRTFLITTASLLSLADWLVANSASMWPWKQRRVLEVALQPVGRCLPTGAGGHRSAPLERAGAKTDVKDA